MNLLGCAWRVADLPELESPPMKESLLAAVCAASLLGATALAATASDAGPLVVAGQKLDSGLGELPHFRHWADYRGQLSTAVVLGESLDDGLGELPHYSLWTDKTGRDPMGEAPARVLSASR
jgi:hypothetical protein